VAIVFPSGEGRKTKWHCARVRAAPAILPVLGVSIFCVSTSAGSRPEEFLADSVLDWGQDMKRLGDFLTRVGAAEVVFTPFNRTYALAGHSMPPVHPLEGNRSSPGWNAVSVTIWKVFGIPAWAGHTPPERRIGRSILLRHFPRCTALF
jgi:hypothetical protein